jgi:hypothetical protein
MMDVWNIWLMQNKKVSSSVVICKARIAKIYDAFMFFQEVFTISGDGKF